MQNIKTIQIITINKMSHDNIKNDCIKNDCINTITALFEKYAYDEYMSQRIHNHVVKYLPKTLDNENNNHTKRINRNTYLANEQQVFIQVFLNKNKYYYLPNNNLFYEYNGKTYLIVKEDDIIHKLLSTISKERILMQWKYKTKINIIKLIKERNLFGSIPETDTIQNILNMLYPTMFHTKNTAKYFLTIIGDNILKKKSQLIFLVTNKMKQLLNYLDDIAIASIGHTNITSNFVTKYHENHSYENCRLIQINEKYSNDIWSELLKKIGLDLLCVATHYSKRFENSDNFIYNKADEELKIHTYYLKDNTQKAIITKFTENYIVEKEAFTIEWKHLHFIWKQFLSNHHLPNIIYSNSLKNFFKEQYEYNETQDSFIGVTSMYVPIQQDFIKFWKNVILTTNKNNLLQEFEIEIEIDELCSLFKIWTKKTKESLLTNGNISEENVIKIITHFFPDIEIVEDKYVLNIQCTLWIKEVDIEQSFIWIKETFNKLNNKANNDTNTDAKKNEIISFDELYKHYNKFCSNNSIKLIASKRYFEKYLNHTFSDYIIYDTFLNSHWLDA